MHSHCEYLVVALLNSSTFVVEVNFSWFTSKRPSSHSFLMTMCHFRTHFIFSSSSFSNMDPVFASQCFYKRKKSWKKWRKTWTLIYPFRSFTKLDSYCNKYTHWPSNSVASDVYMWNFHRLLTKIDYFKLSHCWVGIGIGMENLS